MINLLLGTHNKAKIERYQKFLIVPNLNLIKVTDLPNYNLLKDIAETGKNELENAQIKAKAYYSFFKIPTISEDSGFYIEGLEDQFQPKKNVKGIAGVKDDTDPELAFEIMIKYYSSIAKQFGGQVSAYFLDSYALYDGNTFINASIKRFFTLTDQVVGKDLSFPISSLYLVNNKPYHNLTDQEKALGLKPSVDAATKIIQEFLETCNQIN